MNIATPDVNALSGFRSEGSNYATRSAAPVKHRISRLKINSVSSHDAAKHRSGTGAAIEINVHVSCAVAHCQINRRNGETVRGGLEGRRFLLNADRSFVIADRKQLHQMFRAKIPPGTCARSVISH